MLHELAEEGQVSSGQVLTGLLALPDLTHETKKSYLSMLRAYTKGRVKKLNKLFSQNFPGMGGVPPIRENNSFFSPKKAKKAKKTRRKNDIK